MADEIIEVIAEAAEAQTAEAEAAAAAATAAAAQTITAAATSAAALAEVQAAETIAENKDELSWLRQHATQTESSFQSLTAENQRLAENQSQMQGALTGIAEALKSLTLQKSPQKSETSSAQASLQAESAAEADRLKAEELTAEKAKKKKPGIRFI